MSVKVENLDTKNMSRITVELPAAELDKALRKAYDRQKSGISVRGFRKGHVPMHVIEKLYGDEVFYEDAANILVSQEYPKAYDESGLDIVSAPSINITQIEKGKEFIFTAEVATRPEVTLGKYEGITVTKADVTVTDEEVDEEIASELKRHARTITKESAAELGDTVVIDFDGAIDGVHFDGGQAEGHSLELGSHSFIDTFEDQIVGHMPGDEFDVNVTFPEDYHQADLAGKLAVFAVKLHEIKGQEIPELDDEFVADTTDFETVAEYKADIKSRLETRKENAGKRAKEDEALEKIVEKSQVDLPDAMVDTQIDNIINDYAKNLAQSGLSFKQFLDFSGQTIEKFRENTRPEAIKRIKTSLCLEQIAKEQELEATQEDIDKRIEEMASRYGMKLEDLKANVLDDELDTMKQQIRMEKAIEFVMDHAKERAKRKSKKDEEQTEQED